MKKLKESIKAMKLAIEMNKIRSVLHGNEQQTFDTSIKESNSLDEIENTINDFKYRYGDRL